MMLQLDPPLPVFVTDRGTGYAHFIIDYSCEMHLYWVVFMDNSGECWTVENPKVRMQNNPTLGRNAKAETFKVYDGVLSSPCTL